MDSASGDPDRALYLWSDAPRFEVSTAPLADQAGQAVQLPDMVQFDYALHLSDQQVGLIFSHLALSPQSFLDLIDLDRLPVVSAHRAAAPSTTFASISQS